MPAPRKYDQKTRARAVRMCRDRIRDLGESKLTARRAVGAVLDIDPATLRNWVEQQGIDTGPSRRDDRVLRRARGAAPGRHRAAPDERDPRDRLGVSSPRRSSTADCADLRLHRRPRRPLRGRADLPRAHRAPDTDRPSTYCERIQRPVSPAELADAYAANTLVDLYRANRGLDGLRKLQHAARRAGHPCGRDQVGRLMGVAGLDGVRRGRRSTRTTTRDQSAPRHPDVVDRAWATPSRPDQRWVADLAYVWTLAGLVYVYFVSDVHSRRILGWRVSSSKTTRWSPPCWSRRCSPAAGHHRLHRHGPGPSLRRRLVPMHVAGPHRDADRGRHRRLHRPGRRRPGQRADGVHHRPLRDRTHRPAAVLDRPRTGRAGDRRLGPPVQHRTSALGDPPIDHRASSKTTTVTSTSPRTSKRPEPSVRQIQDGSSFS